MIIGNTLESLLYAWRTQQRIIIIGSPYIFRFDKRYAGLDFSFMNAKDPKELWVNLCFAMSLSSLLLIPANVENIRETETGIDVFTSGSKIKQIKAHNVQYFDQKHDNLLNVYDFFDTRSMKAHDTWELVDKEGFANRINFYSSPRVDNGITKDFVVSSTMTPEQLLNPDWGNGIVKLKALRMFSSAGLTGMLSVKTENKTYYKKPKVEFYKRVVSERWRPMLSFKEIYNMEQERGEAWKMVQTLKAR